MFNSLILEEEATVKGIGLESGDKIVKVKNENSSDWKQKVRDLKIM